jgi:hypothetical protein
LGNPFLSRITNASVLRGDTYGKGRAGFELRQFHKRSDELLEEMDRLSVAMQNNLMPYFDHFSSVELMSSRTLRKYADREGFKVPQ